MKQLKELFDLESTGGVSTIPLPWPYLNHLTDALRPGTVTIIAGPTCVGKSYFLMDLAISLHKNKIDWAYLPLEDSRTDWERRALCILDGTFAHNFTDKENADQRISALEKHGAELETIMESVSENPRLEHGREHDPVDHARVEAYCKLACFANQVVIVDPYAQVEVNGNKPWEIESVFVRNICAIAKKYNRAIVLAMHTRSRPGKAADIPLTVEDIQGSANFCRLFHTVIMINQYSDPRYNDVSTYDGQIMQAEYNTSIYIAKARNGSGTRKTLAFNFKHIPSFQEFGVVMPGGKKK